MFSIEEFIIAVFCCVDDQLREILQNRRLRTRGFEPALSDSEVITMEVVAEFQGIDTDKGIWQYFRHHWMCLFPQLKSRSSFVRQAANLWQYKQQLHQRLAELTGAFADAVHIVDGIPIRVCCFTRAPRCQRLRGQASYGYCAAKDQTFYGFRGHLLISMTGIITSFTLTPANGDEREALWDLMPGIGGLLIGDKGYISAELTQELAHYGLRLQTALRCNMQEPRHPAQVRLLQRVRRLIETVIGQLSERFNLQKVWARDLWHLTTRLNRKFLAHTVCIQLTYRYALEPLQFDNLLTE